MTQSNLWPENLDDEDAPAMTVKAVLERAADELATRTRGKVVGDVLSRGVGDKIEHSFYLRSSDVDYRYLLFKVRHGIDEFPVEIIEPRKLVPTEQADCAAFENALRDLFQKTGTRTAVARLRDLAREVG